MRRTLLSLALAIGAFFIVAPVASAQDLTVSDLKASYTPVGKLPAGTYGVTDAALPASMILDLRADFPKGQLLVEEPGGKEAKYAVTFYDDQNWKGEKKIDKLSLHFEQGRAISSPARWPDVTTSGSVVSARTRRASRAGWKSPVAPPRTSNRVCGTVPARVDPKNRVDTAPRELRNGVRRFAGPPSSIPDSRSDRT